MAPERAPSKARTGGCASCDVWSEGVSKERGARGRARKGARTLGASRPCCVRPGVGLREADQAPAPDPADAVPRSLSLRKAPGSAAPTGGRSFGISPCVCYFAFPTPLPEGSTAENPPAPLTSAGTHSHPGVQGPRRPQEGPRKARPPASSLPRESWLLLLLGLLLPGKQGSQTVYTDQKSELLR